MRHLPPVGWDEVATNYHVTTTAERLREDVTALDTGPRHEMHSLRLELRHGTAEVGAGLRIEMAIGFRRRSCGSERSALHGSASPSRRCSS
jgi:hypothetical protein